MKRPGRTVDIHLGEDTVAILAAVARGKSMTLGGLVQDLVQRGIVDMLLPVAVPPLSEDTKASLRAAMADGQSTVRLARRAALPLALVEDAVRCVKHRKPADWRRGRRQAKP